MTVTDMIEMLKFRLGNRKGMDEEVILREIQLAQSRLEDDPRLDYSFLIAVTTLPVIVGTGRVSLPVDFNRLLSYKEPLFVSPDGFYCSLPRVYEEPALVSVGAGRGTPQGFVHYSDVFQLYPTASVEGAVRLPYLRHDAPLGLLSATENAWTKNAFAVLMGRAGISLAQALQSEALGSFVSDYNVAYQELSIQTTAKEDALFNLARGDYAFD